VTSLLTSLNLKHEERVKKKAIALAYFKSPWRDTIQKLGDFRMELSREVQRSVADAREAYLARKKTMAR